MKNKTDKYILNTIIFLIAIFYAIKFAAPATLRLYITTGMGDCRKLPILCISPEIEISNPKINEKYIAGLQKYTFSDIEVSMPKEFAVVKEGTTKIYYKKRYGQKEAHPIAYLIHENPNFFINLFPQLLKQGVRNDYEFLNRTMYSRLKNINNLTDTFFTIMKAIFIPDLGNRNNIKMLKFACLGKKGFINYALDLSGNYFDCNIINSDGDFFKIYIKDKDAMLDLDKVLAIVSTLKAKGEG